MSSDEIGTSGSATARLSPQRTPLQRRRRIAARARGELVALRRAAAASRRTG
ncbi:MAG: hypothetical protein ABIV05_05885 [Actinomycetota bacterium]